MMWKATSSDIIFTVSQFSKDEIVRYTRCDPKKIYVVYNGIDFNKFSRKLEKHLQALILQKYNLFHPYFLYVGNVKPHKNLTKALLGYKLYVEGLDSSVAQTKFVIVGKREGFITGDEEVAKLLSQPFFKTNVTFTGWVANEDLAVIYQNAALFIFPSVYEGFGFPPLEAMAAGCPVISSNAACLPEIYGDSAFYFDPYNEQQISQAITTVMTGNQVRSALVEKGTAKSKEFDWNRSVERKLAIIEDHLQ